MCHVNTNEGYSSELIKFLAEHNDIALDHQIQAATRGYLHCMPDSWVAWAKETDHRWKDIMAMYISHPKRVAGGGMPKELQRFIAASVSIPLPRAPFFVPESGAPSQVHGVSPKKLHEVFTMSNYVASLFSARPVRPVIVDVGAGQGYLSRALSSSPNSFHVLALDSDDNQTNGSISRKDWSSATAETGTMEGLQSNAVRGSLTHRTVFIGDDKSLNNVVEEWIRDDLSQCLEEPGQSLVPIVLVGLHCCGDLTPSILRFMNHSLGRTNNYFKIVGCVIVGCCYNMCGPTSFPLSQVVSADIRRLGPLSLETQHLHLAAQSPLTWNLEKNAEALLLSTSAALAVRKVTYRALLARRLPSLCRPEGDAQLCADVDWRQKRVGRLRGSAYKDFTTYLRIASAKLGLHANSADTRTRGTQEGPTEEYDLESDLSSEEVELSRVLEVLYVLRCLLGPAVESLIAVDRYLFLQEVIKVHTRLKMGPVADATAVPPVPEIDDTEDKGVEEGSSVQLVNLFDQSTGSLRNLALVWVQ